MKHEEQQKAKELRKAGMSVKKIAKQLNVTPSSVSLWVRNVSLTEEQKEKLLSDNPAFNKQINGAKRRSFLAKQLRSSYQEEGRMIAKTNNQLHAMGCMLYWGEGSKSRTVCQLVNSDPNMLVLFIRFLREIFFVPDEKISIKINCYLNNGLTIEDIEKYWLNLLQLPKSSTRKHSINATPKSSQQKKKNILPYGTCSVSTCDTKIVQHIYGAIQEYAGFSNDYHLD